MKVFLTTILVALAALTAQAEPLRVQGLSSNQRVLGYTLTDDIDINGAAFGEAGTYTIGAALDGETLAPYAGCHIVGIRLAAAMNLGRLRTFVYNVTDTSFDPVVEQRQRIYEGWNNVFFNGEGYEIQGDETLFFGFDYVETQEMVDAEQGGLSCVGEDTEGAFYLYGNYGQGTGLYSIGQAGMLCVQLIVDVSSLPLYDMAFSYLDTGFKHKQAGEVVEILAYFNNVGRDTITSYQVGYQIDAQEPVLFDRNETLADSRPVSWIESVPLADDLPIGMHTLSVFINSINGQSPTNDKGKRIDSQFAIYRDRLPRDKVYVEAYTDATSPYSAMLNTSMKYMEEGNEQVAVVNVHRPGSLLAIDESAYLCDLYAYTYPSFTVNRAYFPGDAHIAYDMNDYLAVSTELCGNILSDIAMQDLATPCFASINLEGKYDETTRQLTVTAKGEMLPEAEAIYGDIALTLLVTEDNVKSRQTVYNQATGRTTTSQNYLHPHVLRGYLTSPIGSPIETDGTDYSAQFSTTLDAGWNADNLTVVALLTKAVEAVTDDNLFDMDVLNATSLTMAQLKEQGTPVELIMADQETPSPICYDLAGRTLVNSRSTGSNQPRGIYLVPQKGGAVRKVMVR